ncbi:MAG: PhoH family protein [Actinomycetota bacterium]|nr:PhoH family protein [Actinomycetota bacterium]MDA3013818.1 PhoH family protein [Actinomycetota bacterium]
MKEITIPSEQDLVNLLGVNDINLKYLRNVFPKLDLNVRGNVLFLDGDTKHIAEFKKVFEKLLDMNIKKQNIELSDLEILTKIDNSTELKNDKFNQIQITPNKSIKLKNITQYKYLEAIQKSTITFGIGPAGTGKTFLAVASAVKFFTNNEIKKIILTRPAVEAGERLGYLPGDLSQKIDPYLVPLFDSLEYFFGNETLQYLIEKRNIEIVPLAYMRGRTLNNACIILDEAQNATLSQIKMFLTRLGEDSKIIITGDETQIDLHNLQSSGLKKVRKNLTNLEEVSVIEFLLKDIVRNKLVSKILEIFPRQND